MNGRTCQRIGCSIALGLAVVPLAGGYDHRSTWLEPGEELAGGDTTVFDSTRNALNFPVRNLRDEHRAAFFVGNSFFNQNWVVAPASPPARDGLGPLFNARSCSACHFKDGRSGPPGRSDEPMTTMLLRISLPGTDARGGPRPDPVYGGQVQGYGTPGVAGEAEAFVEYDELPGAFGDGQPFSLRKPRYSLRGFAYGPLDTSAMLSPRVAPITAGVGLLETVPEATLRALADPDDRNGDGISGRLNIVWDHTRRRKAIGRFGWKAEQPTVLQQTAMAFSEDLGVTSSLRPEPSHTARQKISNHHQRGKHPEVSDKILGDVVAYACLLGVPARRNWTEPTVLRGKQLFSEANCVACHVPTLRTGSSRDFPELSHQTIRPYTDLLLHDMGEGLADNRPVFEANGREWRTPPLWGIGLIEKVNGHTSFLHDGRARNLAEAILWHGGEAEAAREKFRNMSRADRAALISFLQSL